MGVVEDLAKALYIGNKQEIKQANLRLEKTWLLLYYCHAGSG